jgi:uncharacterized protein (TIGR03067 family)
MPNDLSKLQGTWFVKSLEADGNSVPNISASGAKIIIEDEKFTSIAMGAVYDGKVSLNEKSKPKSFDLVFTKGPEKGNRNLGIYKLNTDKWTICLAMRGSVRPNKFATSVGSGFALEVLERDTGKQKTAKPKLISVPPSRKAPAKPHLKEPTAHSDAATELEGEWKMVSAVFNGVPLEKEMVKWCKRITHGNVSIVMAGPQTMLKVNFTLDDSKHPQTIEYMNLEGSLKGKSQSGIVELKGLDLKICMSAPGKPRPANFCSKSGDGRSFTTWRFSKK